TGCVVREHKATPSLARRNKWVDKGIRAAVGTANQECREYLLGLGKQLPPYLQSWRTLCHPVSACVTPNCSQCRWYFWKKTHIPERFEEHREL
uniref:Uncharacterized protein n=1 Tax=Accipiter nisus TaxID=211598 RepID=A0A8B9MK48_9AVES